MKKCFKCGIIKNISEFNKHSKRKDGLQSSCRECNGKYLEKHYKDNKQYYYNKTKEYKQININWLIKIKENLKCSKCGESHIACLDFHHLDPAGKEYGISHMAYSGMSKESILKEIEKCIILCSNCHRKIHYIGE